MNATQASKMLRFKVGLFAVLGLAAIAVFTIIVNNRPYWWRSCQLVNITVEDATGLKTKSPIRSLGIDIGYLKSVSLAETYVTLGICITAPVEILPSTKAYIRGEGFLGDKFVELKPIRYVGPSAEHPEGRPSSTEESPASHSKFWHQLFPSAWAAPPPASQVTSPTEPAPTAQRPKSRNGREIPVGAEGQDVQHLVKRVDELVNQMTNLTDNLKQAINPEDMRRTMKQLNTTLENASRTLAPEGGLTQTAQRSLAKLEDAIEQLRDMMTRVNKGEGSVGMLLNDPTYAEEIRLAVKNVNRLLNRVGDVRFVADIGVSNLTLYNGGRGWFNLGIWPRPDRYYLLGISSDPRGRITNTTTTTTAGGTSQVTQTQVVDQTGILLTGMLGKVFFDRLDLSAGFLYGDGAGSVMFRLGPNGEEDRILLRSDTYVRTAGGSFDDRVTLTVQPLSGVFRGLYLRAGVESFRGFAGSAPVLFYGAGLTFDDEDIKLLFALK